MQHPGIFKELDFEEYNEQVMEEKLLHLYEKYGCMDFVKLEKDGLMKVEKHKDSNKVVKLTTNYFDMIPMVIYGQLRKDDNILHDMKPQQLHSHLKEHLAL